MLWLTLSTMELEPHRMVVWKCPTVACFLHWTPGTVAQPMFRLSALLHLKDYDSRLGLSHTTNPRLCTWGTAGTQTLRKRSWYLLLSTRPLSEGRIKQRGAPQPNFLEMVPPKPDSFKGLDFMRELLFLKGNRKHKIGPCNGCRRFWNHGTNPCHLHNCKFAEGTAIR